MGKNLKWTIEAFKKKGLVSDGKDTFSHVDKKTVKGRVNKIEPDLSNFILPAGDSPEMGKLAEKIENKKVIRYAAAPPDLNICEMVRIKPLSVNDCFKGKRYRTDEYNRYRVAVGLLLPKHLVVPEGYLRVYYEFGLSSLGGDWDNPVKPFQDILQERYGFNDSRILEASVKKILVKKNAEYIRFKIDTFCPKIKRSVTNC